MSKGRRRILDEVGVKAVSVVIPAHNAAGSIAATIASLKSEADVIHEILLVDDDSTDDTGRFAELEARENGLPLRVVRVDKRDAGAARNAGIEIAQAPWIYFIDADDSHLSGGLRALLEQARSDPRAGLVVGAYIRRTDGIDRLIDAPRGYGPSSLANAENYLIDRCETINVGTALISRRTIAEVRFPERIPYEEDTLFWARLLSAGAVTTVDRTIMAYNVSRRRADDRLTDRPVRRFLAWRRVLRELSDVGISEDILSRREGLLAIKIARVHFLRGEFRIARGFLRLARSKPKDAKTAWRYWRYRIKLKLGSRSVRPGPAPAIKG